MNDWSAFQARALEGFCRLFVGTQSNAAPAIAVAPTPPSAIEPAARVQFDVSTLPALLKDTRPDVDLSKLQQATVRHLRKSGLPLETIANAFRVGTDQVQRICKEIP